MVDPSKRASAAAYSLDNATQSPGLMVVTPLGTARQIRISASGLSCASFRAAAVDGCLSP